MASAYGIQSKDIQTDYISIEPSYEDYYADPPIITGYVVRKSVVITLRDIGKFEKLLTGLSEFVPYIGPIAAMLPALGLAATAGTQPIIGQVAGVVVDIPAG